MAVMGELLQLLLALICFVVALVVLGPEKLPRVARALGRWTGMARTYMRNLSAELERETQTADLKKQLADANRLIQEQTAAVRDSASKVVSSLAPPSLPAPETPQPPASTDHKPQP